MTQSNNKPAPSDNKKLEDLFLAIYFNDLEKVIAFKDAFPEIYAQKNNFLLDNNTGFDLTCLTYFNRIIWFDKDWIDSLVPLVNKMRTRTQRMIDFWKKDKAGCDFDKTFEFNRYHDYFTCANPEDNKTVILDSIDYFLEKGFRKIDLQLYNRVECYDYKQVEQLLKQGAKADIDFYKDGDGDALSFIESESSFLSTTYIIPEFEFFEKEKYHQKFDITSMFGNLLGLAAGEKMYHLLKKYQ